MSMTLDTSEFQAAVREHLTKTSRALDKATNARMFYLMLRVFALLPPSDPAQQRAKIRQYLRAYVGGRALNGKRVQRGHLIAQARREKAGEKALTPRDGAKLAEATKKFFGKSIGSAGYLKAAVAKSLRSLNGHFTQFGKKAGKRSKEVSPNSALVKIAAQYGLGASNVSMHRGAKSSVRPARPGLSPVSSVGLSIGLADGQHGKVSAEYNAAMSRAMIDEIAEMRRHVGGVMQNLADEQKPK